MKTKLLLILSFAMCGAVGCTDLEPTKKQYGEYQVIVIDGCEYLQCTYHYTALTHKGNCKNPIHKR